MHSHYAFCYVSFDTVFLQTSNSCITTHQCRFFSSSSNFTFGVLRRSYALSTTVLPQATLITFSSDFLNAFSFTSTSVSVFSGAQKIKESECKEKISEIHLMQQAQCQFCAWCACVRRESSPQCASVVFLLKINTDSVHYRRVYPAL